MRLWRAATEPQARSLALGKKARALHQISKCIALLAACAHPLIAFDIITFCLPLNNGVTQV